MPLISPRQAPAGQASGSQAGGSGGGHSGGATQSEYVPLLDSFIWIMIVTAAIFALLVLLALPRHIARLRSGLRGGELNKGIIFGDKGHRDSPIRQYAVGLRPDTPIRPRHVPGLGEVVPGSGVWGYQIPYTGGYTIGQLVSLTVYASLVAVAIGIKNPYKEPKHVGQVAIFQLPLAVLLGIPMSPISTLLGITYKKMIYFHRFVGRMIFLASGIHVGMFTYKFVDSGMFGTIVKKDKFIGGYLAWGSLCLMFFTSLPFVRARPHSLFRMCHFIGFACLVGGLALHMPRTGLIATIATVIYAQDILLRVLKLKYKRAYIVPMPHCSSTQITVPSITSGWRAGQYVYVRIPALRRMGGMGWMENHPFSIASADGGQLVMVARKRGNWTRALYDLASEGALGEKGQVTECKILLEGPYGGPGGSLITSYSGVVLVAGGAGFTYALGVFEDIVHRAVEDSSRTSSLTLIWCIQNTNEKRPFMDHLNMLLRLAKQAGLVTQVLIYVTRSHEAGSVINEGITIHHHRPDLREVVPASIVQCENNAPADEKMSGVYVGVCGPRRLVQDTRSAVSAMPWDVKRSPGGVNLHTEYFSV